MPDQINWNAVWQSITDTWLPLLAVGAAVIAILVLYSVIRKRKKK